MNNIKITIRGCLIFITLLSLSHAENPLNYHIFVPLDSLSKQYDGSRMAPLFKTNTVTITFGDADSSAIVTPSDIRTFEPLSQCDAKQADKVSFGKNEPVILYGALQSRDVNGFEFYDNRTDKSFTILKNELTGFCVEVRQLKEIGDKKVVVTDKMTNIASYLLIGGAVLVVALLAFIRNQ